MVKTEVVRIKNKNRFVMYPCLYVAGSLFLCRDISFVLHTHEISLHKNNEPASPYKDTSLTGSCYNISKPRKSYKYC